MYLTCTLEILMMITNMINLLFSKEYDGRSVNDWVVIREKKQRPVLEIDSETKPKTVKESKSFSPIKKFEVCCWIFICIDI